jgi:hypothetical protein
MSAAKQNRAAQAAAEREQRDAARQDAVTALCAAAATLTTAQAATGARMVMRHIAWVPGDAEQDDVDALQRADLDLYDAAIAYLLADLAGESATRSHPDVQRVLRGLQNERRQDLLNMEAYGAARAAEIAALPSDEARAAFVMADHAKWGSMVEPEIAEFFDRVHETTADPADFEITKVDASGVIIEVGRIGATAAKVTA